MRLFAKRALAVAGMAVLLGGCAAPESGVKTEADGTKASGGAGAKAPSGKAAGPARLGDTITVKGLEEGARIQVSAVKYVATVTSTDEFSKPAAGNRFVAVQFVIKNTGTVAYEDSPSNGAKVSDAEGQQFDATIIVQRSSAGPGLPAQVKLAPGGTAKGFLVFEVPKAAKIASVQFSQNSGFGETAEWKIA